MIVNWIEGVIGVWILISPWLLGFADLSIAKWSNVLLGLVLIIMNVWTIFGEKQNQIKGQ